MNFFLNLSLVPLSHIICSIICWLSIIVYCRLLYILNIKKARDFKSSFFEIIRLHAITDILMFLYVELLARPRKFQMLPGFFYPLGDHWYPQLTYFLMTLPKNAMFLGYIVVAINRCTALFHWKKQNKFWNPITISLIYFFEWMIPFGYLVPLFYTDHHNFSFVEEGSNGYLLLRADRDFMKLDALQDYILSSCSFFISSFLYFITFLNIVNKTRGITSSSTQAPPTELIILKCAFCSFILFIPNFLKTNVLYFATDPEIINIGTDLWFFTTELMCISSPWSLLVSSTRLREEFYLKKFLFPNLKKKHPKVPRFSEKTAIITGSSNGIGRATAILLAKDGANVTITGRNKERLDETRQLISNEGVPEERVNSVVTDLTDPNGQDQIIDTTIAKFGGIDILVNNAGAVIPDNEGKVATDSTVTTFQKTLHLNVQTVIEMTQKAKEHLIRRQGEIVNVSSIAGTAHSQPFAIYYGMSKAALDSYTKTTAIDLIEHGVRVNSVSPGMVVTGFGEAMGLPKGAELKMANAMAARKEYIPARKPGKPEDIANLIAFLADRNLSSYIIGQSIIADGGTSLVLGLNVMDMFEVLNQ